MAGLAGLPVDSSGPAFVFAMQSARRTGSGNQTKSPPTQQGSAADKKNQKDGTATRRRAQHRRAEARKVGWLVGLLQAERSHHTSSVSTKPTKSSPLQSVELRLDRLEREVGKLRDSGVVSDNTSGSPRRGHTAEGLGAVFPASPAGGVGRPPPSRPC